MAVKCQASSLLGRLEILGPGGQGGKDSKLLSWKGGTCPAVNGNCGWRALRTGFARVE